MSDISLKNKTPQQLLDEKIKRKVLSTKRRGLMIKKSPYLHIRCEPEIYQGLKKIEEIRGLNLTALFNLIAEEFLVEEHLHAFEEMRRTKCCDAPFVLAYDEDEGEFFAICHKCEQKIKELNKRR
jgi:hypothetical protein